MVLCLLHRAMRLTARIAFGRGKLLISCDLLINDDPGDDLRACIGMPNLPVEVEE